MAVDGKKDRVRNSRPRRVSRFEIALRDLYDAGEEGEWVDGESVDPDELLALASNQMDNCVRGIEDFRSQL